MKIVIAFTCLSLQTAMAGTLGDVRSYDYIASFSIGPVWQKNGETQTFYSNPDVERSYIAHRNTESLTSGELFLGIQTVLRSTVLVQLGLAAATTSDAMLTGIIWDEASPLFDNFNYQYKLHHTHIAVKTKLLSDCGFLVTPWVSASLGLAFNNAHNFQNFTRIVQAVPINNFFNHTTTAFTYTLGVGIQKSWTHWQLGLGYEFSDWGRSKLGLAIEQTIDNRLSLNNFYTNGMMFTLSYLA